jgi:TetR/AcrR family transcriptional regulator, transcriptional repressor for nem operon
MHQPDSVAEKPVKTNYREILIQAGLAHLLRKGYQATSVNDVVEGTGIPKGSFYYYFKTKEEFVEAVLQEYARQKAAFMDEHLQNKAFSPLNRLRMLLAGSIRRLISENFETGCLVGHMAQEIAASSPRLRDVLQTITLQWYAAQRTVFEAAVRIGELPTETNIEALIESYHMLMQGAIIEAKMTQSIRGFQYAHWLIFVQIGCPIASLDAETEALLALPGAISV